MKISHLFGQNRPVLSFEIFPPKREGDVKSLYRTIDELALLNPDYISVTYGAAGTERQMNTVEIAAKIKNDYQIEALAHLTSVNASKSDIQAILKQFEAKNIENILALRGDIQPELNASKGDFLYASDLIAYIKSMGDFGIGAACYPEGHIEARSLTTDLIHLKEKVTCGVDFLVTQLFFDNSKYTSFEHEARSLDINVPITVGIMPALNKVQIERMVQLSGATLPDKFKRILNKYENHPEALKDAGISYACDQIVELLSNGVDGIHLYVMNKPEVAKRIVQNLGSILKLTTSETCQLVQK